MQAEDETSDGYRHDAVEQLRHDLRTPLTTIYGRAYLVARAIRRAPSLADEERGTMLAGITAIETAVRTMSAVIDAMGDETRASPSGTDEPS
jgi:signal transduction histidine kinase